MTQPQGPLNTATIIVGTTAVVIENLPHMIELAIRIRDLLRTDGLEANIVDIHRRAIAANTETEQIIADWREKHPQT